MFDSGSDGTFVTHSPCSKCGSSDANGIYTDGAQHCFPVERTSGEPALHTKISPASAE